MVHSHVNHAKYSFVEMVYDLKFVISIQYFDFITFLFRQIVRPCQYDGECEVNMLTRTMCTACRLGKCFAVGMSANLIQKEIGHTKKRSLSTESMKSQTSKCKTIMV
jgi:hypothetical protein